MFTSQVTNVGSVNFPKFVPERIYMQKFYKESGLPKQYKHWQNTVDQMLDHVDTDEAIYLMVDSGIVKANTSHRRAGRHIDGYWVDVEGLQGHRGSLWKYDARELGFHSGSGHRGKVDGNGWDEVNLDVPEALILASNFTSSRGFIGEYDGIIGEGGNCESIDVSHMDEIILQKDNVYISNVGFIHESLPVSEDVQRTLIRLNIKNWEL